ncbi:zinc knuckle CX2CX4HX4C [Artemisia annua]|uniref:Zinc knuckle CX2CX4HX4C n=1 Tax=Artemisia annua TaxID=35608 RepID=A0A2U1MT01_ARTAN|nr:zinc knuckle CX2CX4HX4C [Artemisia annua]
MSSMGEENNTLTRPVNVDESLSYVTMRKHKKSNRNVVDDEPVDKTIGLAGEELNTNATNHVSRVEPVPLVPSLSHDSGVESSLKSKQDFIETLFGVSLKTLEDIDAFTLGLEAGNYTVWNELDNDVHERAKDAVVCLWEAFKAEHKANESPIVQSVDINANATSYAGATGLRDVHSRGDTIFRPLVAEPVFEGVNISIPRKVVEKVSSRLEHTLYGYFMGKRMAFPVVEYYARNNWAKYGLKRIMMNSKGFFFFKFDALAGVEAVLEGGPWMIRKSPIILKKWSMDTCLRKEELTSIPVWVKLHDVPLQVFEEDGISLIATFIGKHVMLDSFTTSMCKESWGRSSFARCLIEVNSNTDLKEVVTIGFPSLSGEDFTKETIRVEYEWRPPRCDICKIFGHTNDQCPKQVVNPHVVSTSQVVTPTVTLNNDGFQRVGKKKKKGNANSTNGNQFVGPSVKQNVRYEPKATTSEPKKGANTMGNASKSSSMLKSTSPISKEGNITTSNSFAALVNDEDEDGKHVANLNEESANLDPNIGVSPSFTVYPDWWTTVGIPVTDDNGSVRRLITGDLFAKSIGGILCGLAVWLTRLNDSGQNETGHTQTTVKNCVYVLKMVGHKFISAFRSYVVPTIGLFVFHDVQIGQRMMTISTVGVPNTIKRLASHKLQSTLHLGRLPFDPSCSDEGKDCTKCKGLTDQYVSIYVGVLKITVSVSQTRGLDASAACGKLRDEFEKNPLLTPSNIDMQSEFEDGVGNFSIMHTYMYFHGFCDWSNGLTVQPYLTAKLTAAQLSCQTNTKNQKAHCSPLIAQKSSKKLCAKHSLKVLRIFESPKLTLKANLSYLLKLISRIKAEACSSKHAFFSKQKLKLLKTLCCLPNIPNVYNYFSVFCNIFELHCLVASKTVTQHNRQAKCLYLSARIFISQLIAYLVSDGNDSEVEEFAEKSYMELKGGKKRVKLSDQTFTCPYCTNKKKRDYKYKELLQRASRYKVASCYQDEATTNNALINKTFHTIFGSVSAWSRNIRIKTRVTWLTISGLPPLMWQTESFTSIANLWGKLEFIKEVVHAPLGNEIIPVRVVESNEGIEILFNGYVFESSDDDGSDDDSIPIENEATGDESDKDSDTNDKDFCPLIEKSTAQTPKTSLSSDIPKPSAKHSNKPVIHSSGPSPIQPQNQNIPTKPHSPNGPSRSPSHNKISSPKQHHQSSTTSKPCKNPINKTRCLSVPSTSCQSQIRHSLHRKKRYASLKLMHPIHGMTQTGRKRESKNNKPLSSLPTKSTSTSSSNSTQISNSSSMINRCNHRIITGNNPQTASLHSYSNEVAETINVGVNLGFDISGKDRDIASIIGSGDHDDIK